MIRALSISEILSLINATLSFNKGSFLNWFQTSAKSFLQFKNWWILWDNVQSFFASSAVIISESLEFVSLVLSIEAWSNDEIFSLIDFSFRFWAANHSFIGAVSPLWTNSWLLYSQPHQINNIGQIIQKLTFVNLNHSAFL